MPLIAKEDGLRPELLLHPIIPEPLHFLNPRNIMGSTNWNKLRKEVYAINDYTCFSCGIHKDKTYSKSLDCHETYNIDYELKTAVIDEFVALCANCHGFIHLGRLHSLYRRGEVKEYYYNMIMMHGMRLMAESNLLYRFITEKLTFSYDYTDEWEQWTFVFNDYVYQSELRSKEEHTEYCADPNKRKLTPQIVTVLS